MKINLISFYFDIYDKSEIQTINRNNPSPHKFTLDKIDFYCYNQDLSGLLHYEKIVDEESEIAPIMFLKSYRDGFAKGLNHLIKKEKIEKKDFYNPDTNYLLQKRLKYFLYHREFIENHKGLKDLTHKLPLIWNEKKIYEQGYFNAVLHSIFLMCQELGIDVNKSTEENIKESK